MSPSSLNSAVLAIGLLIASSAFVAAAESHVDIQVQAIGTQVVIGAGEVLDEGENATLAIDFQERVFADNFGSNFRAVNPGFNVLDSTNPLLSASGAQGFAAGTRIEFDLLPMTIGGDSMNLAFWDGVGDVAFVAPPTGTEWTFSVRAGVSRLNFTVDGGDAMVPGTSVGTVTTNNTGLNRLHQHHRLEVERAGGNELEGVYLAAMQIRVDGYDTSEPFFIANYSFNTPIATGNLAQDWIRDNYVLLTNAPGDFNGDGTVDAADYTVWRDADAPFDAGPEQYAIWESNFGATSSASNGFAVPEPGAAGLTLVALAVLGRLQRR